MRRSILPRSPGYTPQCSVIAPQRMHQRRSEPLAVHEECKTLTVRGKVHKNIQTVLLFTLKVYHVLNPYFLIWNTKGKIEISFLIEDRRVLFVVERSTPFVFHWRKKMTQVWQTSEQILAEYWILASIIHILAFRTDVGCFIKAIQTLLVAFSSETLWLRDWTEPRLVQNPHVVRTGPGAADTMRSFLPLAPFMWNTTSPHLRGRAEERRQRKEEESLGSETEEVSGAFRVGWGSQTDCSIDQI